MRDLRRLFWTVLAFAAAAVAFGSIVPAASATSQAARFVTSSCCLLQGSRATIWSPDSGEVALVSNDFFVTSAYADSGVDDLMQTGITYEFNLPEGPSCDLGSGQRALYYFVEVESNGLFFCYNKGNAGFSVNRMHSVVRNADGYWRAYRDGVFMNIRTKWGADCGGNACTVAAFAEEATFQAGSWPAKFAGSGQTPWQRWTGSSWFTVQQANLKLDPFWSVGGPFPGGIWNLTYQR